MVRRFAGVLAAAAVAAGVLVVAPPKDAGAQQLTKVKMLLPVTRVDEAYAPYPVAKELGYFREEGLDVEFVPTAGGNQVLIQVAAGNADLGMTSPTNTIVGLQPSIGMRVQLFYNVYYRNIFSIVVPPDSPVKTVADLKGKRLGVSSMGSTGVAYGKAYAAKAGLDPEKDITLLPIGVGGQGAAALRTGAVAGAVYWDAMIAKITLGGQPLRELEVDESIRGLPDQGLVASLELLEKRPQIAIGFARALAKGYVFNQANREAAVRITWKHFPESLPRNVPEAEALRDAMLVNELRMQIWDSPQTGGKHGLFVEKQFQDLVAFMKESNLITGDVDLSKVYTNKFIDEINKFDREAVIRQAKAFDMSSLKK